MWSIQKFPPYLYGRHFPVATGIHELCRLPSIENLTGRLGRWILRLQEYNFTVIYKAEKKHADADAPSRGPLSSTEGSCLASAQPVAAIPILITVPLSPEHPYDLVSLQRSDT